MLATQPSPRARSPALTKSRRSGSRRAVPWPLQGGPQLYVDIQKNSRAVLKRA
jgi:hypothetical protein